MEKIVIHAEPRNHDQTGKGPNRRLRLQGKVPVNIIGNGKSELAVVNEVDILKVIHSGIRPATLLDLDIGGNRSQVFIKEIQRFPHTGKIRHIDFYKITPGKKITTNVSIETTGVAKGSKAGGQFEHLIKRIKVKAIPEELTDVIYVDVTDLDVGQSIKVSQLPVPKSWEILVNGDPNVASVLKTRALLAQEKAAKDSAAVSGDAKKDAKKKGK